MNQKLKRVCRLNGEKLCEGQRGAWLKGIRLQIQWSPSLSLGLLCSILALFLTTRIGKVLTLIDVIISALFIGLAYLTGRLIQQAKYYEQQLSMNKVNIEQMEENIEDFKQQRMEVCIDD